MLEKYKGKGHYKLFWNTGIGNQRINYFDYKLL